MKCSSRSSSGPVQNFEKPQKGPQNAHFSHFPVWMFLPQGPGYLLFAPIEGVARYPIDTGQSLATRGHTSADPRVLWTVVTTLSVGIALRAAFTWR